MKKNIIFALIFFWLSSYSLAKEYRFSLDSGAIVVIKTTDEVGILDVVEFDYETIYINDTIDIALYLTQEEHLVIYTPALWFSLAVADVVQQYFSCPFSIDAYSENLHDIPSHLTAYTYQAIAGSEISLEDLSSTKDLEEENEEQGELDSSDSLAISIQLAQIGSFQSHSTSLGSSFGSVNYFIPTVSNPPAKSVKNWKAGKQRGRKKNQQQRYPCNMPGCIKDFGNSVYKAAHTKKHFTNAFHDLLTGGGSIECPFCGKQVNNTWRAFMNHMAAQGGCKSDR